MQQTEDALTLSLKRNYFNILYINENIKKVNFY